MRKPFVQVTWLTVLSVAMFSCIGHSLTPSIYIDNQRTTDVSMTLLICQPGSTDCLHRYYRSPASSLAGTPWSEGQIPGGNVTAFTPDCQVIGSAELPFENNLLITVPKVGQVTATGGQPFATTGASESDQPFCPGG